MSIPTMITSRLSVTDRNYSLPPVGNNPSVRLGVVTPKMQRVAEQVRDEVASGRMIIRS